MAVSNSQLREGPFCVGDDAAGGLAFRRGEQAQGWRGEGLLLAAMGEVSK